MSTLTKTGVKSSAARARNGALGELLRQWRSVRRMSQMDLALDAGISPRHLSFIETGRSVPSRETLVMVADALEVPLRDRNALLNAAGYAPVYTETPLDDPAMAHMREVLQFMLERHQPYPAIAVDRHWNVVMANAANIDIMSRFIDAESDAAKPQFNAMRLLFHPDGLRRYLVNWEEAAGPLIARLHREAMEYGPDEETRALLDEVTNYPGVPATWRIPVPGANAPLMLSLHFKKDDLELRLFSTITTLGTPQDVTLQELRIEAFYPADAASDAALNLLAASSK